MAGLLGPSRRRVKRPSPAFLPLFAPPHTPLPAGLRTEAHALQFRAPISSAKRSSARKRRRPSPAEPLPCAYYRPGRISPITRPRFGSPAAPARHPAAPPYTPSPPSVAAMPVIRVPSGWSSAVSQRAHPRRTADPLDEDHDQRQGAADNQHPHDDDEES